MYYLELIFFQNFKDMALSSPSSGAARCSALQSHSDSSSFVGHLVTPLTPPEARRASPLSFRAPAVLWRPLARLCWALHVHHLSHALRVGELLVRSSSLEPLSVVSSRHPVWAELPSLLLSLSCLLCFPVLSLHFSLPQSPPLCT